jgi:hypothetical protein
MKKKVSALISMMLGVVTIFASCRGAADDNSSSVPESKTYVINNNSSSYQLLLPQDANETIKWIREEVAKNYGEEVASKVIIQYGGSVKSSNAKELFEMSDIDGGLVGGASLVAEEFAKIVNYNK